MAHADWDNVKRRHAEAQRATDAPGTPIPPREPLPTDTTIMDLQVTQQMEVLGNTIADRFDRFIDSQRIVNGGFSERISELGMEMRQNTTETREATRIVRAVAKQQALDAPIIQAMAQSMEELKGFTKWSKRIATWIAAPGIVAACFALWAAGNWIFANIHH